MTIQSLIPGFADHQRNNRIALMQEIQEVMKTADGVLRIQLNAITEFRCENQNIPILPEDFFCHMPNLRELFLYNNGIKELGEGLRGLVSLKTLFLSSNRIEELGEGLRGLVSLKLLYLHNNPGNFVNEVELQAVHGSYEVFLASHSPEELDDIYYLTYLDAVKSGEDASDPKYGANNVLVDSERFKRVMVQFYRERAL